MHFDISFPSWFLVFCALSGRFGTLRLAAIFKHDSVCLSIPMCTFIAVAVFSTASFFAGAHVTVLRNPSGKQGLARPVQAGGFQAAPVAASPEVAYLSAVRRWRYPLPSSLIPSSLSSLSATPLFRREASVVAPGSAGSRSGIAGDGGHCRARLLCRGARI